MKNVLAEISGQVELETYMVLLEFMNPVFDNSRPIPVDHEMISQNVVCLV